MTSPSALMDMPTEEEVVRFPATTTFSAVKFPASVVAFCNQIAAKGHVAALVGVTAIWTPESAPAGMNRRQ